MSSQLISPTDTKQPERGARNCGRALRRHAGAYAVQDDRLAWSTLLSTYVAYAAALLTSTYFVGLLRGSAGWAQRCVWGIASALAVIALTAAMVRTFMLHHDLCHASLFSSRALNRVLALFAGTLVSTSSSVWTREHNRHHRESNNLDHPQYGQTAAWTLDEYERAPGWQRWLYYLTNQRLVMFVLVPPLYFLGFMRGCARLHENALFLLFAWVLGRTGAWVPFSFALMLASCLGFLAFHATHTFEGVVRRRGPEWSFVDNAIAGSSMIVVPERGFVGALVRWTLLSLQYHHIHHLHPGIPSYRLASCHAAGGAMFAGVRRVTLGEALRSTDLTLFDERTGSLLTFSGRAPWEVSEPSATLFTDSE